ncbi:hypothetical protein CLV76_10533 [Marivita geojedonensis]|nr:hypothetical protein CLV76_10533 [Marivita geojedonensis]
MPAAQFGITRSTSVEETLFAGARCEGAAGPVLASVQNGFVARRATGTCRDHTRLEMQA